MKTSVLKWRYVGQGKKLNHFIKFKKNGVEEVGFKVSSLFCSKIIWFNPRRKERPRALQEHHLGSKLENALISNRKGINFETKIPKVRYMPMPKILLFGPPISISNPTFLACVPST